MPAFIRANPAIATLVLFSGFLALQQPTPSRQVATKTKRATTLRIDERHTLYEHLMEGRHLMQHATTVTHAVEHANTSNFDDVVLKSDLPVLVDFYADWCGPCQRLAPVLHELASENPKARIVKVNVDESPELAARYGISSIPNLQLFKAGHVVNQQVGLASKSDLELMLRM